MRQLIVGGTKAFPPLRNVLCRLTQKEDISFDAIWLIDTPETICNFNHISESIKSLAGRRDILVSSLEVNEQNAAYRIPDFMAQFVMRDANQIKDLFVDLTTGPKYVTSLLYASANFCQINNIHYFLLKSNRRDALFEELREDEYEYLQLPPFNSDSLALLSRRSHIDLIYYLKDLDDLVRAFSLNSPQLADELDRNIRPAVRDYFEGNYKGVIRSVGSLMETWTDRIYKIWRFQDLILVNSNSRETWHNELAQIQKICNKLQKVRINEVPIDFTLEQLEESLPLAVVGNLLEMVRVYRNIAAHKADQRYQIERDDAKLVLDIGFAFARKCEQAAFMLKYGWGQ